jgi:membrane protease YdiL (CAAX protease family)
MYIKNKSNTWGFTGTFLWGLVIAVLLLIGQVLPLLLYALMGQESVTADSFILFLTDMEKDAFLLSLSVIGSAIFVVPLVFGIAKLKKGSNLQEYFSFHKISWKTVAIWIGVLILLLIFEGLAIEALGADEIPSFMMNIEYPSVSSMWVLLFAVTFMAPLVEEVVFRGFLLTGFSQSSLGVPAGIVITSALWAVIHLQYELAYVAVIFVVGLVFGYARVKTNSILTPMMMHFMMNLVASIGLFYEKGLA